MGNGTSLAVRFCARKLIYCFLNPSLLRRVVGSRSDPREWVLFGVGGVVSLIIRATEVSRDFGRYQEGREMVYHLVLVAGAWPTLDTQNLFVFVVRSSLSRPRGERRNLGPLSLHQNELTKPLLFPFFSREIERRKDKLELKPNG